MKILKRNLVPIVCCILYILDLIGRDLNALNWITLVCSAAYIVFLICIAIKSKE